MQGTGDDTANETGNYDDTSNTESTYCRSVGGEGIKTVMVSRPMNSSVLKKLKWNKNQL